MLTESEMEIKMCQVPYVWVITTAEGSFDLHYVKCILSRTTTWICINLSFLIIMQFLMPPRAYVTLRVKSQWDRETYELLKSHYHMWNIAYILQHCKSNSIKCFRNTSKLFSSHRATIFSQYIKGSGHNGKNYGEPELLDCWKASVVWSYIIYAPFSKTTLSYLFSYNLSLMYSLYACSLSNCLTLT